MQDRLRRFFKPGMAVRRVLSAFAGISGKWESKSYVFCVKRFLTRFRAPGRGPEFTNHSRIPELSHIISHSRCFLDIPACKCFNTGGKFRTPPGTRSRQSAGQVLGKI